MFEVFDCVSGKTIGYFTTKWDAKAKVESDKVHYLDYSLANCGFYVIASKNGVDYVINRHNNKRDADREMDAKNMADDYASYSVRHVA